MQFKDIQKICSEEGCGREFVFTARDQEFYAANNFSEPKRCMSCRRKKKAKFNQQ